MDKVDNTEENIRQGIINQQILREEAEAKVQQRVQRRIQQQQLKVELEKLIDERNQLKLNRHLGISTDEFAMNQNFIQTMNGFGQHLKLISRRQ